MVGKLLLKLPMGTNKKTSSGKTQLKLTLPDDVIERLEVVAAKAGKSSKQEVVEELIAFYLPVWTAVNESMSRAVEYHVKMVSEDLAANVREKNQSGSTEANRIGRSKIFREGSEGDYRLLASRQEDEEVEEN